jgi:hypothetical protein
MPSTTTIRVTDASGTFLFETAQFLETGNDPGLHYVLSCGLIGNLTVTLPTEFNDRLPKDGRIHVMRSVNGGMAQREGESCFLIRKWVYANDYTTVFALHANHILWRRCALWGLYTGEAEITPGSGTGADDAIKSGGAAGINIWDSNFGANAASGNRNDGNTTGTDISAYVSVQADVNAAPEIDMAWYWMNTGDAVRMFCDASMTNSTYLTAEIVAPSESTLELRTYTGQRGEDRRASISNGLLFTEWRGNLANALMTVDATEEITFALAGGQSRDSGTSIRGAIDTARVGETPLGRIEMFVDVASADASIEQIQAAADAAVRDGRPIISAVGDLQETDQCVRGVHFNYGDLVTVEVGGVQYDMRLDVMDVTLQAGVETTKVGFFYNG